MSNLIDIDDRWLDVDFDNEVNTNPELIANGVTLNPLNSAMPPGWCLSDDTFESSAPMMSDSECMAAFERQEAEQNGASWLVSRIFDQDGEGACVSDAFGQGHETRQAFQYGLENVTHLSAISLYKRIGRSAQSGAMVSDGMEEMFSRGILPLDTPENRARFGDHVMPNIGFNRPFPPGWESTAALFAGFECKITRTVNGLYNALATRRPCIVGRDGHSICYTGGCLRNGLVRVPYPNSWKITWGQAYGNMSGGFGFDSIAQIKRSAGYVVVICGVRAPQRPLAAETIHSTSA